MKRPHVTIASRIFVPEPAAASFRLKALAEALRDEGCEVTVLTTSIPDQLGAPEVEIEGIEIKRLPALRDKDGYIKGYLQYLTFDIPLFFRLLATKTSLVVCEPPPTTGFVTRVAATLKRIPYVYYAPDIWADAASAGYPGAVVSALRFVENAAMKGAAQVVTVSQAVAERLSELKITRVTVAPNGIDTDVFSPTNPREIDADGRYFVYAGTSSEWQGAEIFAQALAAIHNDHPDVRLYYVGQGSSEAAIEQVAATLPAGTISRIGRVDADVAAAWQRDAVAALVSIRPGLGYDFAMPTKVYSALSCGAPVLYAGPGPLRDVIAEKNLGTVVDYDVDQVAAAMSAMLSQSSSVEDVSRRRQWVLNNRSLKETGRKAATGALSVFKRATATK